VTAAKRTPTLYTNELTAQAHSISLLNLVKPSNQFRSKNKSSPIGGHHPQEKPVIVVGVHERGNRGRHRGWPQVPPDDVY
jgi:hypothetical protein